MSWNTNCCKKIEGFYACFCFCKLLQYESQHWAQSKYYISAYWWKTTLIRERLEAAHSNGFMGEVSMRGYHERGKYFTNTYSVLIICHAVFYSLGVQQWTKKDKNPCPLWIDVVVVRYRPKTSQERQVTRWWVLCRNRKKWRWSIMNWIVFSPNLHIEVLVPRMSECDSFGRWVP